MKGGVTAIGIGLGLVLLWMWSAENEMRAPLAPAGPPTPESRDASTVATAPSASAPGIGSDPRVVGASKTPQVEPPSPRSETGPLSSIAVKPRPALALVPAAEPVPDQPVEPAPLVSAEAAGTSTPGTTATVNPPDPPRAPEVPPIVSPPDEAASAAEEAAKAAEIVAIRDVLDRYKRMYDRLDASAAASIWPSVDSRALTKMFSRLDSQLLEFEGCVFALWENGAAADCTGWLNYVPRVGTARREAHAWTIELTRGDEGWRIVKVMAR